MKPPTMVQATERGLVVDNGIHTFSNGTEWECWADGNCFDCKWYDAERAGDCAFEGYALLGMVSPALALLFGWTESKDYPGSYHPPESCRFFVDKDSDEGRRPTPPDPDPLQLVLIADPTEVIANLNPVVRETVSV